MSSTKPITVELPAELVEILRDSVRSGAFASEGELLSAMLGWSNTAGTPEELDRVRAMVAEGIADAEAGRVSDAEDVYARVIARIEAMTVVKTN